MKCTRHRCHDDPENCWAIAALEPSVGIGDDQMHPGQPAGLEAGQELTPEPEGLTVPDRGAQHLPGALDGHPGGHHQCLRDHMGPDPDLAEGGISQNTYGNVVWVTARINSANTAPTSADFRASSWASGAE
jgi:hypothetical protein